MDNQIANDYIDDDNETGIVIAADLMKGHVEPFRVIMPMKFCGLAYHVKFYRQRQHMLFET